MSEVRFAHVEYGGRNLDLEYEWLFPERKQAPLLLFLHEGLGSIAMWRDFPRAMCEAGGYRGLMYSREGYGRSTKRLPGARWPVEFMQVQAIEIIPKLFAVLGIDPARDPLWLFGHSDGGSIALIYAAHFPVSLRGVIALAPHIFVEDLSVASIREARETYLETDLRAKLARYHDDPDSAFWGWNDAWLDPVFRHWNIEALLPKIRCPVLAIQGESDQYGTMAQIENIRAHVPQTELLKLPQCGHSPHRDQPERVTAAVLDFIRAHAAPASQPPSDRSNAAG